jgi:hypothetical protein
LLSAGAAITSRHTLPAESWEFADIGDPEGHKAFWLSGVVKSRQLKSASE